MAKQLTAQQRKAIQAKLFQTTAGRQQLAAELSQPLREYRDYIGLGRSLFLQDKLNQGELPYYDKDVEAKAYVLAEDTYTPLSVNKGADKIFVPTFDVATKVTTPITGTKVRGFNVEQRIKTKSKSEIFGVEDRYVFNFLINIAKKEGKVKDITKASFSIDSINEQIGVLEGSKNILAANIVINPAHFAKVRAAGKDYYTPNTNEELMRTGRLGVLFGCNVLASAMCPADKVIITAEPETLGVFVDAFELTPIPISENRHIGFELVEAIGLYANDNIQVINLK